MDIYQEFNMNADTATLLALNEAELAIEEKLLHETGDRTVEQILIELWIEAQPIPQNQKPVAYYEG